MTATRAPAFARARQLAAPMPLPPPVRSASLPVRSMLILCDAAHLRRDVGDEALERLAIRYIARQDTGQCGLPRPDRNCLRRSAALGRAEGGAGEENSIGP